MAKRILIFGVNFSPELTGIGKYSGEMAYWMANNDFNVTMVTSYPYYPNWKIQEGYTGRTFKKEADCGDRLTIYRCPIWVPSNPNGIKRIIHEASFFVSAFCLTLYLLFKKKHDLIFSIAPPFHLGFIALFYKLFKGGKIVYHIQDLQVDAARDLNMLRPRWLFPIFFNLERFILRNCDYVSTISLGMLRKIKEKVRKAIILFPNWVDTDAFFPVDNKVLVKQKFGFSPNDKIILYSGSIGEKQGLDCLVKVAKRFSHVAGLKFIISGTGPYKVILMQLVEELALNNVHFFPLQPYEDFNDFLNAADVHLVLQKGDASDLVMPSKLTTILSVGGLAVVTANFGTSLHDIIKDHEMGIVAKPECDEALFQAIEDSCTHNYECYQVNARKYAETFLNKDTILSSLLRQLGQLPNVK